MSVREVAGSRDVRTPYVLIRGRIGNRYNLRRIIRTTALLGIDVAALLASLPLSPRVWDALGAPSESLSGIQTSLVAGVLLFAYLLFGLYGDGVTGRGLRTVLAAVVATLVAASLLALAVAGVDAVRAVALGLALFGSADLVLRSLAYAGLRSVRSSIPRPTLLVGSGDRCEQAADLLASSPAAAGLQIAGAVTDAPVDQDWERRTGLAPLASLDGLEEVVRREHVTDLLLSDPELLKDRMPGILELARRQNVTVHMAAPQMGFDGAAVSYVPGLGMPVFVVQPTAVSSRQFVAKRAMDIVLAAGAMLLLSPLLVAVAVAVKATSRGPILFASRRVGLGQRQFDCYKYRTMYADAEERQRELERHNEADGAMFKIRNDPRVTPVGRFLRRTSIDELPQLLNVLRGDMSLVGPRPLPVRDNDLMEDWHKRRHVVLPGITGLWQVSGRSDLGFDQLVELDFRYIENWSLAGDVAILARTLGIVLTGRGAY